MSFLNYPITQGFGPTDVTLDSGYAGYANFNKGNDYATPVGTPINAVVAGTVVSAGDSGDGWGISVKVRDAQGYLHNYGHLSSANVRVGQQIGAGTLLGASGNTGKSTGPHLSYDVQSPSGEWIDPTPFVGGQGMGSMDPAQLQDAKESLAEQIFASLGTFGQSEMGFLSWEDLLPLITVQSDGTAYVLMGGGYQQYQFNGDAFVPKQTGGGSAGTGFQMPNLPGLVANPATGSYVDPITGQNATASQIAAAIASDPSVNPPSSWQSMIDERTGELLAFNPATNTLERTGEVVGFAKTDPAQTRADELHRWQTETGDMRGFQTASLAEQARQANLDAALQQFQTRAALIPQFGQLALQESDAIRDILSQGSDFLYRAYTTRGGESPLPQVTQADQINHLRGQLDQLQGMIPGLITPPAHVPPNWGGFNPMLPPATVPPEVTVGAKPAPNGGANPPPPTTTGGWGPPYVAAPPPYAGSAPPPPVEEPWQVRGFTIPGFTPGNTRPPTVRNTPGGGYVNLPPDMQAGLDSYLYSPSGASNAASFRPSTSGGKLADVVRLAGRAATKPVTSVWGRLGFANGGLLENVGVVGEDGAELAVHTPEGTVILNKKQLGFDPERLVEKGVKGHATGGYIPPASVNRGFVGHDVAGAQSGSLPGGGQYYRNPDGNAGTIGNVTPQGMYTFLRTFSGLDADTAAQASGWTPPTTLDDGGGGGFQYRTPTGPMTQEQLIALSRQNSPPGVTNVMEGRPAGVTNLGFRLPTARHLSTLTDEEMKALGTRYNVEHNTPLSEVQGNVIKRYGFNNALGRGSIAGYGI